MAIVTSFSFLCLLLVLGKIIRVKVKLFQKLYLPASIIGGILGLIIVQIFGSSIPSDWTAGWIKLPGFLINIVFAALFLGVAIPSLSTIWEKAGPQLAYGQIVAWGQWVIGIGFVLLFLKPMFHIPDLFGGVL
ncbi:sodium:glutamate symporter, partial [bacterium]|nr:sodium:glutamate symporter [bacterium]